MPLNSEANVRNRSTLWEITVPNIDTMVLEQALRERSEGTMVAPLRDVVRLAIERWAYPGSVGSAEAILLQSGRYDIEADPDTAVTMIRPRGVREAALVK